MKNKIKVKIPKGNQIEVELLGKTVKIDSRVSLEKCEKIYKDIKEVIFQNSEIEEKFAMLKIRLIRDIIDLCTNIDISELEGEDFNSQEFSDLVYENIENIYQIEENLAKEYDKWVMENCFGFLATKLPTAKELEESFGKISETVKDLPTEKLELIAKSIVWNNAPALGSVVAPATHIEEEK